MEYNVMCALPMLLILNAHITMAYTVYVKNFANGSYFVLREKFRHFNFANRALMYRK